MDNPVGLCFTPGGERIFSCTFLQHPGGGKRDGLIHAIYGGIYGKDHDVIYDPVHKWTGPDTMPVMTHLGPAAPCGLRRYESKSFGPEYENNLFCCCFNMRKVTRHVLVSSGATFTTKDEDWLVSNSLDFHPTDALEDADGSLLILDTGGWYKLCCPTSALVKPDVAGAIYRVRKVDAPKVDDPRGLKIESPKLDAKELAKLLGDERPAVQRRAMELLAKRGERSIPALTSILLTEPHSALSRLNAVWTATRIDCDSARTLVRDALKDDDEDVRQAALQSVSLFRDREALPLLRRLLSQGHSEQELRLAVEAIGRIGDKQSVPDLVGLLGGDNGRVFEHAIIYALIQTADPEGTAKGLKSPSYPVRRGAMVALDQMNGGKLDPEMVAKELTADNVSMRETAGWIMGRHPEWGDKLAGSFRDRVSDTELTPSQRDELARQLAKQAKAPAIVELLANIASDARNDVKARQTALRGMAQAGPKQVPELWLAALISALDARDADVLADAATTVRVLPWGKQRPEKLVTSLMAIGSDMNQPSALRLKALAAIPGGASKVSEQLYDFLTRRLISDQTVADRTLAADILVHSSLSKSQLVTLTHYFQFAGPMEINPLLEAFALSNDDEVGVSLIGALSKAPAQTAIRPDLLKKIVAKYGVLTKENAEELFKKLNADAEKQKAKLEEMLTSVKEGDIRRGQVIFNSQKASCISCHAIGYVGGKVGPDLTRVGSIRSERDLLESIMFPSASIAQGYEPVLVTLKNGKQFNGLLRGNAPDAVHLVLNATEEKHIAREDIEEILPSKVSVMPNGLDQQLSKQDLADLVAFLKACK
jgi:putative heme-binding domain-containing protein